MKLSRRWLRLLGCSFQFLPLLTSTSVGILCIKHGNQELVPTSTHYLAPTLWFCARLWAQRDTEQGFGFEEASEY